MYSLVNMFENFDEMREKYLKMVESAGADSTLSMLHNEMTVLEQKVFDGGFDQKKFDHVQQLRELSREIWTSKFKLSNSSPTNH